MAFYKIAEMQKNRATANPRQFVQSAVGKFMKAGIVTKPDEEGPPLRMHPNEEQFTLVLEGELHFVFGDEERICEAGDLIHIPTLYQPQKPGHRRTDGFLHREKPGWRQRLRSGLQPG